MNKAELIIEGAVKVAMKKATKSLVGRIQYLQRVNKKHRDKMYILQKSNENRAAQIRNLQLKVSALKSDLARYERNDIKKLYERFGVKRGSKFKYRLMPHEAENA